MPRMAVVSSTQDSHQSALVGAKKSSWLNACVRR